MSISRVSARRSWELPWHNYKPMMDSGAGCFEIRGRCWFDVTELFSEHEHKSIRQYWDCYVVMIVIHRNRIIILEIRQ